MRAWYEKIRQWFRGLVRRLRGESAEPARVEPAIRPQAPPPERPPPTRSEPTIEDLPHTYTGLLDDVMLRYSNDFVTEDFFRKMIAKNVFFGGGILFNDGYLVNHPVARRYLQSDGNILRTMLSANFVRILTRAGDAEGLTRMPVMMAESGNASYHDLVHGPEWAEFRDVLRHIAANAFRTSNTVSWPTKDMSVGYAKLMSRVFASKDTPSHLGLTKVTSDDLARIEEDFLARQPHVNNPRDKFEKAAHSVLRTSSRELNDSMREVMDVANQCYHYNFGLGLTDSFSANLAVDTTIGRAFDELLAIDSVDAGQLDDIPVLRVPKDVPFDNGALFLPFLDHSSRLGRAKITYLTKLDDLLRPGARSVDDLKKDVAEATDEYVRRIVEHLAPHYGRVGVERMLGDPITLAVGKIGERDTSDLKAAAAPTAGIAISLLEEFRNYGRDFLFRRFSVADASTSFDPTREQLIKLGDIRPQIASLAFNRAEAAQFISDVPDFKG